MTKRLMIFGHPSHELALFGMLQREPAEILIIDDGGGPRREADSRQGLATIGLQARYLSHPESAFYKALLARDVEYFRHVTDQLRRVIEEVEPDEIYCDAVEFYNPVHDVTLPMVRTALGSRRAKIFEVPLVYQEDAPGEVYRIQRVPPALAGRRISYELTAEQVEKKDVARLTIYSNLREQAGPEFMTAPREYLAHEEVLHASHELPAPGHGRKLRYEWRARLLRSQGLIREVITYADHYMPAMRALTAERQGT